MATPKKKKMNMIQTSSAKKFGSAVGPSTVRMCTKSALQEGGGSVFILLWAVSGHHYLTAQKESCKQMLVAHSAAIVRLAVAAAGVGDDLRSAA